jgi:hypothetical protein
MPGDADLEMGLRWDRHRDGFDVNLRLEITGDQTDDWLHVDEILKVDIEALQALGVNEASYGNELTRILFDPPAIREFFSKARAATARDELMLHLRLHLNAPAKFHAIRWESLRDPEGGSPLATRSDVYFSRYLSSSDWRPIKIPPQHEQDALIVVAGPDNVSDYSPNGRQLAPVAVDEELERARTALSSFERTELAHGKATLSNIVEALRQGVDILYLVCHGALIEDVPHLVLERSDRTARFVDGRTLVERLSEIDHRPTIAMLLSCQSAAGDDSVTSDEGELSGLGPRLVAAGVAAVVGMQGNVTMGTVDEFAPAFFASLADHGVVDRAMSKARQSITERPDWWVPVLYSRLRSGRTYYVPEFTKRGPATWNTLKLEVPTGEFTPVLGPGLADAILGSREEVAARWVRRWQMPIAAHNQGDLTQVAQYLRVRSAPGTVRVQLKAYLSEEIARRAAANKGDPVWDLPDELQEGKDPAATIREIGRRLRSDPGDPYRVAAAFPVDTYVTTGWTDLLEDALLDQNPPRKPVSMTFRWLYERPADVGEEVVDADPTVEKPLVYHLFGHISDPDSIVLTEDDHFAWLIAWIDRRKDIPPAVRKAMISKSLLFLGYRLDDWDFRVVFQGIKSFGGSSLLTRHLHVGVQLSPDSPMLEPEAAQEYLESYFGEDRVNIYWGNTRGFLDRLRVTTGLET